MALWTEPWIPWYCKSRILSYGKCDFKFWYNADPVSGSAFGSESTRLPTMLIRIQARNLEQSTNIENIHLAKWSRLGTGKTLFCNFVKRYRIFLRIFLPSRRCIVVFSDFSCINFLAIFASGIRILEIFHNAEPNPHQCILVMYFLVGCFWP